MYLAVATRPDISSAVQQLSEHFESPGRAHWEAAKRVVRYLLGTRDWQLALGGSEAGLVGYSDSDWGADTDFRHSISGYVFTLDGGAISWASRKQKAVALSSTEAEYIAITEATKEAMWLRALLGELLGEEVTGAPTQLWSDNRGAIALAKDNTGHRRTKHIDIRYHFIREAIEDGKIALGYCPTVVMPADAFTKALARPQLVRLLDLVGVRAL